MNLICSTDNRRDAVRRFAGRNGLDYLEVGPDQLTLSAYFLGKLPRELAKGGLGLTRYFAITGGDIITGIRILKVEPQSDPDPEVDDFVLITLDKAGDFSRYTLRLSGVEAIDPFYAALDFSFKLDCPSEFDCADGPACPVVVPDEPKLNYLAKDYASFRQLLLDRLALLVPDWTERHAPDLGITLIELLAYTADYLSYYQDAVATEAYLGTARQRISVRRHARLVDYILHEGCNARAFLHVGVSADPPPLPAGRIAFVTALDPNFGPPTRPLARTAVQDLPASALEWFEPLGDPALMLQFRAAHNAIPIYDWGRGDCCLAKGATSATLVDGYIGDDRLLSLQPGDLLLFEEVRGARTGDPADADPARRWVVRLTRVEAIEDPLFPVTALPPPAPPPAAPPPAAPPPAAPAPAAPAAALPSAVQTVGPEFVSAAVAPPTLPADAPAAPLPTLPPPASNAPPPAPPPASTVPPPPPADPRPQPLLAIEWAAADALPFALCLSAIGIAPDCARITGATVARGNIVIVDHGRTVPGENLPPVPGTIVEGCCECAGQPALVVQQPARFRPVLAQSPVVHAVPWSVGPASTALAQDVRAAIPAIALADPSGASWHAVATLIDSDGDDRAFVAEINDDGAAVLRFGDGAIGRTPDVDTSFVADYRVGGGIIGNVGPEALTRIVLDDITMDGVDFTIRNPLAARGGADPEPVAQARLHAPSAFRQTQSRAITAADYAAAAARDPALQRAAAALVWTGSWWEAAVTVDPLHSETADPALLAELTAAIEPLRRIGHDLRVGPALYVPIVVAMQICVKPGYDRGHLRRALVTRLLGTGGFFDPDQLTFGDGIMLSRLIAAAMGVTGVESATVTTLNRQFEPPAGELAAGLLPLAANEIARLDNDPDHPEHGQLTLTLCGGR